jgi:photosystem II stability/assembly factor-like uncharacterized protein
MKPLGWIVFLVLLLSSVASCAFPTESSGVWEILLQTDKPRNGFTAAFLDDEFGITVGHAGDPYYTTDGGQTWVQANSLTIDLCGLDMVDEETIWAVGDAGLVRRSSDGGRTWETVSRLHYPGSAAYISFVDDQVGWAASLSQLEATSDSGQTWAVIRLPDGAATIAAISLRSATDGYLLDDTGTLYVTQDGGESWAQRSLGLGGTIITTRQQQLAAVRFLNAEHGLVILSLEGELGEILALRTADGGRTWQQEIVPGSIGPLHLTYDGRTLTVMVLTQSPPVTVLGYEGP